MLLLLLLLAFDPQIPEEDGTAKVEMIDDDHALVTVVPKEAATKQGQATYNLLGFARVSGKWVRRGFVPLVCSYEWNAGGEQESLGCETDLKSFKVAGEALVAVTETIGSHYGDYEYDSTRLQIFRFLDGELVPVLNEKAKGETHTDTFYSDFDETLEAKMTGNELVLTKERKVHRQGSGRPQKAGRETKTYVWNGATFAESAPAAFVKATATASSELSEKYAAKLLVDGDPKTLWAEGVKGPGLGETITLAAPGVLTTLRIRSGNAKSLPLFLANHRPKTLRVNGVAVQVADHRFPQDFAIEAKDSVKIEIVDVYRGSKADDTCITDLQLR